MTGHLPTGTVPTVRPPRNRPLMRHFKTEKIQIERKTFVFTLKENPRGRFLRITEDVGGRRDNIIIRPPAWRISRR